MPPRRSRSPPPQPKAKKARYATGPKKGKKAAPSQPKSMSKYRFKKKDWPVGAEGFLKACDAILRMAWGLDSATAVPQLPPADVIAEYIRMREGNTDNTQPPPHLSLRQQQFNSSIEQFRSNPDSHNRVLGNLSQLEDYVKSEVTDACLRHGLSAWRPDFRASPESPYNEVHRRIWEQLVDTLIPMGAFSDYRIDYKFLKDKALKRKQFNHFVFFRSRARWQRELTSPGAAQETASNNVLYRRRSKVKDKRMKWCADSRVPRRQERACEDPAAHSDDDLVDMILPDLPDEQLEALIFPLSDAEKAKLPANTPWVRKKVYRIRRKPYRSAKFTKYYIMIDAAHRKYQKYMKKRTSSNIVSYPRIRDSTAPEAHFLRLPDKVPLDYFDPGEFNSWPISMRRKYLNARIALPLDVNLMSHNPAHESMTMKEGAFMKKYGEAVRAQYDFGNEDDNDEEDAEACTDSDSDSE